MPTERTQELYNNMLNHISELVSGSDLMDTLHAIGFTDEEIIAEGFEIENEDGDDYVPSATNGDYSPSNPWDAPGMSIHDFI